MAKRKRALTQEEILALLEQSDSDESSVDSLDSWTLCVSHSSGDESNEDDDNGTVNQSASVLQSPVSKEWSYNVKDISPHPFVGTPGLNVTSLHCNEMDFFNIFFSDDLIELIVKATNSFAEKEEERKLHAASTSQASPSFAHFTPVTADEFRVFLALIITSSIVKKPDIKMYFSTNQIIATPFFNSTMSRDRFLSILRYMHFTEDGNAKKLDKIKPVLDILLEKFKNVYTPEENICIDESLFSWKGRLGFRQYIPSKRSRYGIKIYKLSESKSGYVWNFLIYTGKDTLLCEDGGNYGERVVRTLFSNLTGKGYNLYLDRFFTSPSLADYLSSVNTNMCGTVQKNRKGMPKNFPPLSFEKEIAAVQKGNTNIIAFKDKKKVVLMLTSMHNTGVQPSGRTDRKTGANIMKPTCILDYNKNMGGVDMGDASLTHYPAYRKTVKWYRKLFFGFLDITLLNANAIYNHHTQKKCPALQFRLNLVEQILGKYFVPQERPSRPLDKLSAFRLSGRHFPKLCSKTGKKDKRRRCVVCSQTTKEKRKRVESYYECTECDVGLCIDPCFEVYHTQKCF